MANYLRSRYRERDRPDGRRDYSLAPGEQPMSQNPHCMLIDGANIDGVLGEILTRQPVSKERPRWDKVVQFHAPPLSPDGRKTHFFIAVDEAIPDTLRVSWPRCDTQASSLTC